MNCGCKFRKILDSERKDYAEGTDMIVDSMCSEHEGVYRSTLEVGGIVLNEVQFDALFKFVMENKAEIKSDVDGFGVLSPLLDLIESVIVSKGAELGSGEVSLEK